MTAPSGGMGYNDGTTQVHHVATSERQRCNNQKWAGYSWIGPSLHAHEKLIPEPTKKAETNPGPLLGSSWQGESKSAGYIFV